MPDDEIKLPERYYIAKDLRRPSLEVIATGAEVFIVAEVFGSVHMSSGDPSIGVMIGRLGSHRSVTSAPLTCVTQASAYARASDLGYAEQRLQILEARMKAIEAALGDGPIANWQATVEQIIAIVRPPAEPEDDA